jgi:hypothetical protein
MDILRTLRTQLVARKDHAAFYLNCILAQPTMENSLEKAGCQLEEFSSCMQQIKLINQLINQSDTSEHKQDEV